MIQKISASSRRSLVVAVLLTLSAVSTAGAQGFTLTGTLFHATAEDSTGLPGSNVLLHAVTNFGGAAIDSADTDRNGRYRFFVSHPDTSAEYFVSVEHDDIGYFSSVIRMFPGGADSVPTIVVYDTTYAEPVIELRERHIIVRHQETDGTRQFIELVTLVNGGRTTRIAADTSTPVWEGLLPAGAFDISVGQSDVGVGAIYPRGASLAIAAPVTPGQKQVLFSYLVPRVDGRLGIPIDQPMDRLTVSIQDTTATAEGPGLMLFGLENVGGTVFKRYDAERVSQNSIVSLQFRQPFLSTKNAILMLVAAVALLLSGTLTWWYRKNVQKTPH